MNDAIEIRTKLTRIAKEAKRPTQEILQYYAMERFLYRLSRSEYREKFVLKGGLLFTAWNFNNFRVTQDVDLLGMTQNHPEHIAGICQEICSLEAEDGVIFDPATITTLSITPNSEYSGVQVKFKGKLGPAKLHMRVDIGFADAVYPKPTAFVFPTILERSAPHLLGYTQESVIAEKVDAMLQLGELNSRMKDFYDIWYLANRAAFEMPVLAQALNATFLRRKTQIPNDPHIFSDQFRTNPTKQKQWENFCLQNRFVETPDFFQLMKELSIFLEPIIAELASDCKTTLKWSPKEFSWN